MSRENVDLVRDGYGVFLASGAPPREHYADEFVWDMSTFAGWPERRTYEGYDGMMEFIADWSEAFEDWELEVEDYLDAGDEVVTIVRQRGRSRGSGTAVEMRFAQVWTLLDGRYVRMRMFASPEEGLEAAGLSGG